LAHFWEDYWGERFTNTVSVAFSAAREMARNRLSIKVFRREIQVSKILRLNRTEESGL
jgi:predicted acyltransferase